MYQTINEQDDEKLQQQIAGKITPAMLGLKPTTDFAQFSQQKIIDESPEKAKSWSAKGSIGVMEAGRRFADDFYGNYQNIISDSKSQNVSGAVDLRIAKKKKEQEERKKRINNGTADILDKIQNGLDEFGDSSFNAQVQYSKQNEDKQKPNKNNSNFRYEIAGADKSGNVIYNEIDLIKKIGFAEGLSDSVLSGEALPFIGGYLEGRGKQKIREIKSKIEKNESITQDELNYLNNYVDRQHEELIRGYTVGGHIGASIAPSLLAFGSEIAMGGAVLKGLGLAGAGIEGGVNLGKTLLKSGKVSKGIAKATAFASGQLAEAGLSAAVTSAVNPQRLYATYQERRLNDEMKITDRGTVIFSEAKESPARAFFKSLGKVYVSYFTEGLGGLLGGALIKPIGKVAGSAAGVGARQFMNVMENTPQLAKLIKKTSPVFAKAYEKLNNLPIKGKSAEWLKSQVKFDGFIEECGEEVLEDVLNLAIGSDDKERSLDNYVNAVFKSPEEWAVIAGTIALQGGALSLAGNLLGDHMQRSGANEEDILKVLSNSTENEKIEMIDELLEKGSINLNEDAVGQEAFDEVSQHHKNKLLSDGINEKKAEFATSFLMTQLEQLSKKTGKPIDELYEEEAPEIINRAEPLEGRVEYNQELHPKEAIENIEKSFGDSVKNLTQYIKSDVSNIINENNLDESEFNFEDIRFYGSYTNGKNKKTSDLDVLVQYSGSMREDAAFNMFADAKLYITDAAGKKIKVDINPINTAKSGTINEHLADLDTLQEDGRLFQAVNIAGAEAANTKAAIREWNEKGTDSEYFKKWFGDSKVVDEARKPLVVYHGTMETDLSEFDKSYIQNEQAFFFTDNENVAVEYARDFDESKNNMSGKIYPVYLSMKNPLVVNANGKTYSEYYRQLQNDFSGLKKGYDGLIIKNIKDNKWNDTQAENSTVYAVLSPEQIKSVDNQGTFDVENPNIYYQSDNENANIVDLTNDFEKTPSIDEVKVYIKELVQKGSKYATLSPDWFVDIKGNSKKQKHIVFSDKWQKMNKSQKARHNKYVKSIEKLLNGAEYLYEKENKKIDAKPNIEIYHYFKTNVIIGESNYEVIFDTEQYKGEKEDKPQTVHLYNISEINKTLPGNRSNDGLKNPEQSSIHSITDGLDDFKLYDSEQRNIFPGNREATKIRNIKGAYIPAENLIELFKNADESTIVHEYAHWYLSRMEKFAPISAEIQEDLEAVRKFVKNGGEAFTREQHEKFARGFEAYIRSGNARNNRLKRIFEDFKNALISIYDEITKIIYSEDGIDKPFTKEDLPQIQNLFDRLMSTENERIQRTVFDKCDEIDEKIKKIRANQDGEFAELDKIYTDNINSLNRKSDKKRQVDEYLELANKAVAREPKELKEFRKRYKDATLSILELATGYDRRFISNSKNWEKVQLALENSEDKITAQGGIMPEWAEFYSDTGVSYENDEVGGDYELALKALDVLREGNYNFADFEDKEISNFIGKFDYLHGKVLSLKGEEKTTALEALYSLFGEIPAMPDEVTADLLQKIQEVGEAYESQQKEDFNKKSYPNIPVVQQLQFYVTNKLNNLKVYNPDLKYKSRITKSHSLYKLIKNATSVNNTKKIVRKINEYVIDDLQGQQRGVLHKEIQKQIKVNSKLVKTGSVQHGKFDWRTNTIFAELAALNKMKRADVLKEYINFTQADNAFKGEEREDWKQNRIESEDVGTDFQSILKKKFLEYRSLKIDELNVLHTRSVLEDIMALKFEGRRAKSEEDLKKKLNKFDFENNLIEILEKHRKNKVAKAGTKWIVDSSTLANWESLLNATFDKETAERYSLLSLEAQAEVYARDKYLFFLNKAANIYGFKEPNLFSKTLDYDNIQPLIDLFKEYENEIYTYKETTFNRETGKYVETNAELSKAQIMTLFTWSLNEELEQRIMTQYGVTQWQDMVAKLSQRDQQLCWALVEACENMYEDTNEVFIRTLGLSLPHVENYFPSKTERIGSDLDLFHDFISKSNNPSFIKQRKKCNRIKMSPQSPFSVLLPHINKTARYVVLSETVNFYNKVFQSADLKAKIKESYGKDDGGKIHKALLNQLSASTFTTYARGVSMVGDVIDKVSTNYITSKIGGSLKVTLGQLLSVINYAENMPPHVWAKGWTKSLMHPVKTFNYMIDNCPYLKARLAGNTQNEIIATLTSEADKFRTLKNFCTLNVRWGDIIAITLGGKPYVDYLIKQGMSKEAAFDKFVEETLRAQQAGLNSSTSEWQKAQAKTALGRMFFAFRNTDIQYERKYVDSLIRYSKGDIDGLQLFKTIALYKILNPVMFLSFLQNMSILALLRALLGGDDPEKNWGSFGKDMLMSIGLSGLNAYGLAGFAANSLIQAIYAAINKRMFDEDYKIFDSSVPVLSELEEVLKKILVKEEPELSDWVDAVSFIGDNATGAPVTKSVNIIGGVGDVINGELGIGTSRMAGWGNYIATEAWTGKAPKKKKRRRIKYE